MIYLLTDSPNTTGPRTIGAYRIATVLRKAGFAVEVIDYLGYWKPIEVIRYIDSGPKPLWIGFSSTFSAPNRNADTGSSEKFHDCLTKYGNFELNFWKDLKERSPIVIGGSRSERLKYFYDADYIVTGYADNAVVPISLYISGATNDLKFKEETIESLRFPNTSYTIKQINCEDMYPMTDVSDITTEFHETDFIQDGEVLPLEVSRGCIFKCAFCAFPLNGKSKNDYIRPKEQIKKDIELYKTKYKSNQYLLMDDTFNDTIEKMQMMKEIYDEVGPFDFWAYGRLDLISSRPDMLNLIDKIGWKYFSFGVETFERSAGKKIGKGADPEKLKKTLKEIKQKHPSSHLLFEMIVGLPGETPETIQSTFDWFKDNLDLWEEAHFKGLFVANKKYQIWNSAMSENPEKFGLQVYNNPNSSNPIKEFGIFWKHETMSTYEADQLASKITVELDKIKPRRASNYFLDFLRVSKKISKKDPVNSFDMYLYNHARNYIKLKFVSRTTS